MLRNFETLYPDNFFIEDKCLYEIRTTSKGNCEKKICNFLPWIVREITVDDGVETKTHITLSGIHADGRTLPECEISAEELASFHW
ncbi:MAG: hypothetical protein IKC03_02340, partial [Oscillospiraceae bacterium]|nr:hypothetical protein [Oscillospiraceae bacterium]